MDALLGWIRNLLLIYFLLMIVMHFSAGKSYQKFIRFFMGLVLVLMLLGPFLRIFDRDDTLKNEISYETFRQNVEVAQLDFAYMEEQEAEMYRTRYEQLLEQQLQECAKEQLLAIRAVHVRLDENYEVREVVIEEGLPGDGETFCAYLMNVYGWEREAIKVV